MITLKSVQVRSFVRSDILIAFILLTIYVLAFTFLRGFIPPPAEIIANFSQIYARFGYLIIFLSALAESIVILNFFTPGMIALSLGAIFARVGAINLFYLITIATIAILIGYSFDYFLGRFGATKLITHSSFQSFLTKARQQLIKVTPIQAFLLFSLPNLGSFTSLAAGTLKMNPFKFYTLAIPSTIFWASFWATLIFFLGQIFLQIMLNFSLPAVIAIFLLYTLFRYLLPKAKILFKKHVYR